MKGKRAKKLLAALLAGTLVLGSVVGVSAWTGASGDGGWWDDGTGYSSDDTLNGDGTWYYVVAVDNLVTADGEEDPSVMFNVELYGDTVNDAGTGYITTELDNVSWTAEALTCDSITSLELGGSADRYSAADYVVEIIRDGQDFTITYMDADGNGLFGWTFTNTNFAEEINLRTIAQWGQVTCVLTKGSLTIDEATTVQINDSWEEDMYYFIPETSGKYTLTSTGCNADAYCYLYEITEDGDLNTLSEDDDSGETDDEDSRYNFALSYWLEAGELYFYNPTASLEYYKSEEAPDSESYTVTLTYSDEEVIDSLEITELVASANLHEADCSGTKVLVTYKSGKTSEVVLEKVTETSGTGEAIAVYEYYKATDEVTGNDIDDICAECWTDFYLDPVTNTVTQVIRAYAYSNAVGYVSSEVIGLDRSMTMEVMALETDYTVTLPASSGVWYEYTPTEEGQYTFSSTSESDINLELYYKDDEDVLHFCSSEYMNLESVLSAGTTYFYCIYNETDEDVSASVCLTDTSIYLDENLVVTELELDVSYAVKADSDEENTWYSYTPERSGYYRFSSQGITEDSNAVMIVDSYYLSDTGKLFTEEPGRVSIGNFSLFKYMEAGVTYYFSVSGSPDEDYSVILTWGCVNIELLEQEYSDMAGADGDAMFSFTPVTDGNYYFNYTLDGYYTYAGNFIYYFEENEERVSLDGEYETDSDSYYFELKAGVTYYFVVFADTYDEETDSEGNCTVTVVVTQENHEHTYTNAADHITWTWAEDYSSAAAIIRCDACAQTVTLTAVITSEKTDSSIVYTATVTTSDGTVVTDTRTVPVEEVEDGGSSGKNSETNEKKSEPGEDGGNIEDSENTSAKDKKMADAATTVPMMIALLGCAVIAISKKKSMS